MKRADQLGRIDRRGILKTGVLLAGGTLLTGPTSAEVDSMTRTVHEGESVGVGNGQLTTRATTDGEGNVVSLDVHLDGDAIASFAEGGGHRDQQVAAHVHFPTETENGDALDHQFTYMGFHYNPQGHAPPGVYTVPHFDFHFHMLDEETVGAITGGPLGDAPMPFVGVADYDIPEAQQPPGYTFERHRFIIEEMGEHQLDATAPEFNGESFTNTYVYGIHDPAIDLNNPDRMEVITLQGEDVEVPVYAGDGTGRIHFVEPMITTDFISHELDRERTVGVATPARFPTAGEYPTTYVMRPDDQGGVSVAIDGFKPFLGSGE